MSVMHKISVIIDWSAHMGGQVEKPERCDVSGDDSVERWLKSYCDKKCLNYSDTVCWMWTGRGSILYTRVDATQRFHEELRDSQAFEIKIVTKPDVCYVAALRAQIEKAQVQSDNYEAIAESRDERIKNLINRYQQQNREHDDIVYKLQTEQRENAEKVTNLENKIKEKDKLILDLQAAIVESQADVRASDTENYRLEKELREADDNIAELHSETVKYSKDLHDAHVRAQHEHSRYMLRLSKVGMKRSGGAGAVDEDVSEMTDVPDVLDGLNARELGGRTVAWLRNAKAKASQFVQKLAEAEDAIRAAIPDSHLCPITQDVMKDPVMIPQTGQSYERTAIEKWLEERRDEDGNVIPARDPKTNVPLTSKEIVPNLGLRHSIEEMQARV
jgi:hypothetical protein